MEPLSPLSDYRVEVSGWDVTESFFVEKTTLELGLKGERRIQLRHPLRPGAMVFLRLIDSRIGFPALPVTYQVVEVSPAQTDGASRVTLRKVRHRKSNDSEALPPSAATETI